MASHVDDTWRRRRRKGKGEGGGKEREEMEGGREERRGERKEEKRRGKGRKREKKKKEEEEGVLRSEQTRTAKNPELRYKRYMTGTGRWRSLEAGIMKRAGLWH